MTLLSAAEDDEHLPEFGILQVRDRYEPGRFDGPDDVVDGLAGLEESDTAEHPVGTLAVAGVAWLQAHATSNEYHRVRLEAHDAAPTHDTAEWSQVMETPYFCRTGAVYLTAVTGTSDGATVPLEIGLQRVRVVRRPADDEGDRWRLQFWPDPVLRAPRWIKRTPPGERPADVAGDLISLLLWTGSAPTTVAALGHRLSAGADLVVAAIGSQLGRFLRLDAGDPARPLLPIVLAVQARPTLPPAAVVTPAPPAAPPGPPWQPVTPGQPLDGPDRSRIAPPTVTYHPPPGPAPRAGYITDAGELLAWREGELVTLAQVSGHPGGAIETAHGILIAGGEGTVMVRGDGRIDDLGLSSTYGRLDEHGRRYAVVEWHLGRHEWYKLHLIDLADGSRHTMLWDESQPLTVNAVHDGVVRFNGSMRWRPGHDPEPAAHPMSTIDPLSGVSLWHDPQQGPTVAGRDGVARRFTASCDARLAPGGQQLYEFGDEPASLVLFDAVTSRTTQTYWLPPGSETGAAGPHRPIWEDRDHLLVWVGRSGREIGAPIVRLDVATGGFEGVGLAGQPAYARLIQPLLAEGAGDRSTGRPG